MPEHRQSKRFIYQTKGVCPPEIHLKIAANYLNEVRFVGGGCPGHSQLVTRLLRDRLLKEVLQLIENIECRNGTSCPDQLSMAITAIRKGQLLPADAVRLSEVPQPKRRLGLVGDLGGNLDAWKRLAKHMSEASLDAILCLGNLAGPSQQMGQLIKQLRKSETRAILGALDWAYAQGKEPAGLPALEPQARDWLLRLPQALSFYLENRQAVAFFGDYLQQLPGFSDYAPYALEMNMVCGLTEFMQDESVFPALEAMLPQFKADLVVFAQPRKWGYWQLGDKHFISLGPADELESLAWGLLESRGEGIDFERVPVVT